MNKSKNKYWIIYMFGFLSLLMIYIIRLEPGISSDLYRYYEKKVLFNTVFNTYNDCFKYIYNVQGDFIFYTLIFYIGKLGLDNFFLPMLIILFYYSSMSYIYLESLKVQKNSELKKILNIFLGTTMIYPYILISTLRFPLAIAFFSIGVFLKFKKKSKIKSLFFMICSFFTHTGMFLGILVFFIYNIIGEKKKLKKIIINMLCIITLLINIGGVKILASFLVMLKIPALANKLISYSNNNSVGGGLGQLTYMLTIFFTIFIINISILKRKKDPIIDFLKILGIFVVLSLPISKILVFRYTWIMVFFLPYILINKVKKYLLLLLLLEYLSCIYIYRFYIIDNLNTLF